MPVTARPSLAKNTRRRPRLLGGKDRILRVLNLVGAVGAEVRDVARDGRGISNRGSTVHVSPELEVRIVVIDGANLSRRWRGRIIGESQEGFPARERESAPSDSALRPRGRSRGQTSTQYRRSRLALHHDEAKAPPDVSHRAAL